MNRKQLAETIEGYAHALLSYEARYQHAIVPLIPFRDERSYGMDRALIAAGRLFGITKRHARKRVHSAHRMLVAAPRAWMAGAIEERAASAVAAVPDVTHLCGWVYTARLVDYPHIFKIGITSDPSRRLRELQYQARTGVIMERVEAGTYFEEAYRLLVLGRLQISGEWFFDPDFPIKAMPEFLCHGRPLEQWQRAFDASMNDAKEGANPIGALGNIYVEILGDGGTA